MNSSNRLLPSINGESDNAKIESDIILIKRVLGAEDGGNACSDRWEESPTESDGSPEESDDEDSCGWADKNGRSSKGISSECIGGSSNTWQSSEPEDELMNGACEYETATEPTLENCLYLNRMYQEIVQETIQEIDLLLMNNREKQHLLQEEMQRAREKPSYRHSSVCIPTTPYFKDARGHYPPPNEDTIHKGRNGELRSLIAPCRPWLSLEKTRLMESVKRNALERLMQPIMARKEILCMEIVEMGLTEDQKLQKMTELKVKEKELSNVKCTADSNLIELTDVNYDWLKISVIDFDGTRSGWECELYWKNYLHPSINKNKWNRDEFMSLKKLVERFGHNAWDQVAAALQTNRTALQCFEKYQTKVNPDCRIGKWTPEESEQLLEIIDNCRVGNYIPWYQVSYLMDGRSGPQIRHHWTYNLNPQIRKGRWTEEEDLLLLAAVWMFGPKNWWKIKDYVPGRTCAQCNERWVNSLDPSLLFGDWLKEEDNLILKLVETHGRKWSMFARQLKGRTDAMISQRWKTLAKNGKTNEGALAILACSESYRERLYRRLAWAIRSLCSACKIAKRNFVTKDSLKRVISNMSVSSCSMNVKYMRHPADQLLSRAMMQLSMTELKRLLNHKPRRKSLASYKIDQELDEYFMMLNTKRKRGRPPKLLEVQEDDPTYTSVLERFEIALQFQSSSSLNAPFIPPVTRSLQAFRNILLLRKRLKHMQMDCVPGVRNSDGPCPSPVTDNLNESHCVLGPAYASEGLTDDSSHLSGVQNALQLQPTGENAYQTLFAQFVSLFFWPAVLSTVRPAIEEPCHPVVSNDIVVKKRPIRRRRETTQRKKRKRPQEDDSLVVQPADGEVLKRKPGRPMGSKNKVFTSEDGVRRSSRRLDVKSD